MSWYNKFLRFAFRNELDILAQNIARNVFNQIVQNPKSGQIIVKTERSEDSEKDINLDLCGINKIFFDVMYADGDYVYVEGEYTSDWNFPRVLVWVNLRTLSKKHYEALAQQLKYAVRHEIEHAYHKKQNPELKPSYSTEVPQVFMEQVELIRRYLSDPSEIDAYIRDSMLKAKNLKIPLENIINELIEKRFNDINPVEVKRHIDSNTKEGKIITDNIKNIKNLYLQRIKQIYNR